MRLCSVYDGDRSRIALFSLSLFPSLLLLRLARRSCRNGKSRISKVKAAAIWTNLISMPDELPSWSVTTVLAGMITPPRSRLYAISMFGRNFSVISSR